MILETAKEVKNRGAHFLRAGAYKPLTFPYRSSNYFELREKGILPTPKAETFSNFLDNFIAENTPRGDAIPIDKKGWPIPFGPSEFPKA